VKRLTIRISAISLVLLFFTCVPATAQLAYVPHEDPEAAKGSAETLSQLTYYKDVLNIISGWNYKDRAALLEKLKRTDIPEQLKSIAQTYGDLAVELNAILDEVERSLNEVALLILQNSFTDAQRELDNSDKLIEKADELLEGPQGLMQFADTAHRYAGDVAIPVVDKVRDIDNRLTKLAQESTTLRAKFYPSQLEIGAPEQAYPGLPIEIGGKISSEGNIAGRDIKGLLDGEPLFKATTDDQGLFRYQLVLAKETWVGEHKLSITVAPEDKSRSAGCSFDSTLTVVKATPQVKVRIPKVSILPQTIEVTGEVYSELPLQGATVTLQIAGVSTATTLQDGKFKAKLRLPLKLNIMGFQEAKLNVKPLEPWHSPFETKAHLFVLNPVNLGVILAAFVSLGILSTKRRREVRRVGKTFPAFAEIEQPVKHALEKPRARLEGRRGIILEAYFRVINLIERVTRFSMESQMTLREFLKVVKPDIGGAAEAFSGMTNLAEVILYSPYKPQEGDVLKAKKLASRIMEALTSGKP